MPRFSLKTLLVGVAICAACLGAWSFLFRKAVYIRPAQHDDRIAKWQARWIQSGDEVRDIAYVVGKFNHWTRFHVSLTAVRAGQQQVQNESILQTHYRDRVLIPTTFETMLVLRTRRTPQGTLTFVDYKGALMAAGSGQERPQNIPATFTYSDAGSITPGRPHIVYVEGDTTIDVSRGMTLKEFAEKNSGNYFVITAELK